MSVIDGAVGVAALRALPCSGPLAVRGTWWYLVVLYRAELIQIVAIISPFGSPDTSQL